MKKSFKSKIIYDKKEIKIQKKINILILYLNS